MEHTTSGRPILRFPDPTPSFRRTGSPRPQPRARGPSKAHQHRRFQATFDRLGQAFRGDDPASVLRRDPVGIAPERALVFVTAGRIQHFARAARAIGLEVFAEADLDDISDFPEEFEPPTGSSTLPQTLYCTMPTLESYRQLLSFWTAYRNSDERPDGAAPWWNVFDLLLELRPWGPNDRLTDRAREVIADRLPEDDSQEVPVEFEIWPTPSASQRSAWQTETERRVVARGGQILDRSSISQPGFIYEAILAGLPAGAVRHMLEDPQDINGLVTIQGVQFILPWTTAQTEPPTANLGGTVPRPSTGFVHDAPLRVALLDGTPVAAHSALSGGVVVEDVHDLVRFSEVRFRYHATAMASLILRGDLDADGVALRDTRLVSVPLLLDTARGAWSPNSRLFVDLVYTALIRLVANGSPVAPDLFIINLSIGVVNAQFSGRVSSLARLIDWFAAKEGVLFVVSAGNVDDLATLDGGCEAFEGPDCDARRLAVQAYMRDSAYSRTLLSPAEALNAITVGALSADAIDRQPPSQAGIVTLEGGTQCLPQITSAVGLGPHRAIKPDVLNIGGRQELALLPKGEETILRPLQESQRTGLRGAAPTPNGGSDGHALQRGTSAAAALTTRALLQAAEALTKDDGPYAGQELPRQDVALATRALAVNAALWPDEALDLLQSSLSRLGSTQHARAKEEVCRFFGYGTLQPERMRQSPENGVSLIGFGTVKKDQAQVFRMPLPASISGEKVPRSMRVTIAWFTPVNPARAQYRLAALEAMAAEDWDEEADMGWGLALKPEGPDANQIKRGSIWSRRLTHRTQTVPDSGNADVAIRVQCRDASGGGLDSDADIRFAVAVTFEVEASLHYDVYDEMRGQIGVRLRRGS